MQTNNIHNDELEQMKSDMQELRSLLSKQKIVNERLMRRAMKRDIGKERTSVVKIVILGLLGIPLYYEMTPIWHLPQWFLWTTIGFLITAIIASIWSIRRLLKEDLLTGDLLAVAKRIADYKRFSNQWLKFSIPFLCFWLASLTYYVCLLDNNNMSTGILCGMAVGLVIGGVCGVIHLRSSHRRLDRIVSQIEEITGKNA